MIFNARHCAKNIANVSSTNHIAPPLIKKDGGLNPRPILGLQRILRDAAVVFRKVISENRSFSTPFINFGLQCGTCPVS